MGLGPPKVMKSTFCSATTLPWKHRPPLCHLDRSAPGLPTSRCWQLPRVRLSLKRAACRSSKTRVSTGNPGERSGEISVWMLCPGNVFLAERGIDQRASEALLSQGLLRFLARACFRRLLFRALRIILGYILFDSEVERTPIARAALRPNPSSVLIHNPAGQGQS